MLYMDCDLRPISCNHHYDHSQGWSKIGSWCIHLVLYNPLKDYAQLFISKLFPLIVSPFVDFKLNINFIPVFVWKTAQKVPAMFDWWYSSTRNSANFSDGGSKHVDQYMNLHMCISPKYNIMDQAITLTLAQASHNLARASIRFPIL